MLTVEKELKVRCYSKLRAWMFICMYIHVRTQLYVHVCTCNGTGVMCRCYTVYLALTESKKWPSKTAEASL